MTNVTRAHQEPLHVSFLMVEFPAGTPPFTGDMAAELMRLHDVGLIRVLDLVVILKDADGGVRGCETTGLEGLDIRRLETDLPRILAADDVSRLAEALEPGTTAGVVVWDDTWTAPLVTAVRSAGGEPVAAGHIATSLLLEKSAGQSAGEVDPGPAQARATWEPLSPERHPPGVLTRTVARAKQLPRLQPRVAATRTGTRTSHVSEEVDDDPRS